VPSYADDLALAHLLADTADAISTSRFRALDLRVQAKPDLTPVSDADTAVEKALRATLAQREVRYAGSHYALAVVGTRLLAGGAFHSAGGSGAQHIAFWNDTSWSVAGTGMNDNVRALAAGAPDWFGWMAGSCGALTATRGRISQGVRNHAMSFRRGSPSAAPAPAGWRARRRAFRRPLLEELYEAYHLVSRPVRVRAVHHRSSAVAASCSRPRRTFTLRGSHSVCVRR